MEKSKMFLLVAILFAGLFPLASCNESDEMSSKFEWDDSNGGTTDVYKYPKASQSTIRLMTYNSYYCRGNYPESSGQNGYTIQNMQRFARVIKALDADIVAIQELDKDVASRNERYLLQEIALATGEDYQFYFGEASSYMGGKIGPGVLVRASLPVSKVEYVALPGDESRILIVVELEHFVFMGTHLDTNDSKRCASGDIINEKSNSFDKPVFLAGDMNDSPQWTGGGAVFPILQQEFVIKSATQGTLPDQPNQTIDYILFDGNDCGENIEFQGSHVVKSLIFTTDIENLETVSDHYPVILDIISE